MTSSESSSSGSSATDPDSFWREESDFCSSGHGRETAVDDTSPDDLRQLLSRGDVQDDWASSSDSDNPELLTVRLQIAGQLVSLRLTDNMIVQDVTDIVGDMFGIIDDRLSLELDNEILEPYRKLKSLGSSKELEFKVKLRPDQSLIETSIRNKEESKQKQYQTISVQTKVAKQMVSRITQTPCFPLVDTSTNTPHDKYVQVDHDFGPNDKVLVAREYVEYDTYMKAQHEQAIMIQKSIRRFLAQKRILQMKKERDLMIMQSHLKEEEITREKLQEELKTVLEKHSIPCQEDYSKAYSILAEWLKKEKSKIKDKKGQEKTDALNELFRIEMSSLNYINQQRITNREKREEGVQTKMLEKASKPVSRRYPKGHKTTIQSENTEIAKAFNEMVRVLKNTEISNEERIRVLDQLVEFLTRMKVPECTDEMVSMAKKEKQMMLLGIGSNYLEGARKRLLGLFLDFSTNPEFNPGIEGVGKLKDNVPLIQCRICKELKPSSDFNVDILRGLTDCTLCTSKRELSQSNLGMLPYKALQKDVYSMETQLGSQGDYVSLLQPPDFFYLVQTIWEGRSCLSESTDIKLLRFVRWDKSKEWSPWNCILLTGKEAELHLSIEDRNTFYGKHFIKRVENKHLQAKLKFKKLQELYWKMKSGGEEEAEDTVSISDEVECPLISDIHTRAKKLNSKFIFTEPISDLVFP